MVCAILSGKKPRDRAENGYPPRSHDRSFSEETEFTEAFQQAQEDLERKEKDWRQKRTMMMWKNSVDLVWATGRIQATRAIINRQPKAMRAIIENEGGRTPY